MTVTLPAVNIKHIISWYREWFLINHQLSPLEMLLRRVVNPRSSAIRWFELHAKPEMPGWVGRTALLMEDRPKGVDNTMSMLSFLQCQLR